MAWHFGAMGPALVATALSGLVVANAEPTAARDAAAPLVVADARADYESKLAAYQASRAAFEEISAPYWDQVRQKRQLRNTKRRSGEMIVAEDYVLTQPPLYNGPPRPIPPPDVRDQLPPPGLPCRSSPISCATRSSNIGSRRPGPRARSTSNRPTPKSPVRPDLRASKRFASMRSRSAAMANTIPRPASKRIGREPTRSRPRSATINC